MKVALAFLLICGLLSCSKDGPSEDDYKIINATFVHLRFPTPSLTAESGSSMFKRDFGYDNFIFSDEQIRAGRKEAGDNVFITEYLVSPQTNSIFHDNLRIRESYRVEIKDPEFWELAKSFAIKPTNHAKLEIELIKNIGLDQLIPVKISGEFNPEMIGSSEIPRIKFTYSTIHYNKRKDKACFYFQYDCKLMCSSAKWVFVEKIDGIWTIKEAITHWVS